MNILVTGATGFIGSHLVRVLLKEDHCCRCLVRVTSKVDELESLGVELFYGDLTKPDSLQDITKEIDIVYHLAAMGHVSAISDEAYQRFRKMNVQGTENLVKECVREPIGKFIHFSSTAAMGLIKKPIVDERTPCKPSTPYQKSKFDSEQVILSCWKRHNLPGIILRPCMVYGPGGSGEFLKWCRLIKKGIFPRIGKGRNLTPLVHVEDVVQAAILARERGIPGETYLIASNGSFKLDLIRNLIVEKLEIKRINTYIPTCMAKIGARGIELLAKTFNFTPIVTYKNIDSTVTDRVFSINKVRDQLGYFATVDIDRGIGETIQWYRDNGYL